MASEAANRLREAIDPASKLLSDLYGFAVWPDGAKARVNKTIAQERLLERRATVERIREKAAEFYAMRPTGGTEREAQAWRNGFREYADAVAEVVGDAILDEEAAR